MDSTLAALAGSALRRAASSGAAGLVAGELALVTAASGDLTIAAVLALIMVSFPVDAPRWVRLAGRSGVGARSGQG